MALAEVEDGAELEGVQGLGQGVERGEGVGFEVRDDFDASGAVFEGEAESEVFGLLDDVGFEGVAEGNLIDAEREGTFGGVHMDAHPVAWLDIVGVLENRLEVMPQIAILAPKAEVSRPVTELLDVLDLSLICSDSKVDVFEVLAKDLESEGVESVRFKRGV